MSAYGCLACVTGRGPHKCRDCDEETLNEIGDPMDGRCRDCDIDYIQARGACRECLRWLMREEFAGPLAEQHAPGCSLSTSRDCYRRTEEEIPAVRAKR